MGSLSNPDAYSGIVKNSGGGGSGNDFPVNITDPQEGQILTFDSVNEEWVNTDSNIKVIYYQVENDYRTITQDEIDDYLFDSDGNSLNTTNLYSIVHFSVTLEELSENKLFILYSVNESFENFVQVKSYVNSIYFEYINEDMEENTPAHYLITLGNYSGNTQDFHVTKNNIELRDYTNMS